MEGVRPRGYSAASGLTAGLAFAVLARGSRRAAASRDDFEDMRDIKEGIQTLERTLGARKTTIMLVQAGVTPRQIAAVRGVSLQTTFGYIDQAIGAGALRRSDVLFTLPPGLRASSGGTDAGAEGRGAGSAPSPHPGDLAVIRRYGSGAHALGDMYEHLCAIEQRLHELVRARLIEGLGADEAGWWRKGIPESIRKVCQTRREEDEHPAAHAYHYTDLLDLGDVIDANWPIFREGLPACYHGARKLIQRDLRRLNGIRRRVMHPVRHAPPGEDDFRFTRSMRMALIPAEAAVPEADAAFVAGLKAYFGTDKGER